MGSSAGVSYFTAAGNFGNKSYRNNFNPVPAPDTLSGFAHDFGGEIFTRALALHQEHILLFCNGRQILFA